jgi:hypothetical protein
MAKPLKYQLTLSNPEPLTIALNPENPVESNGLAAKPGPL